MKNIFRQIVKYVSLISILEFAVSCEKVEEGGDSPNVYVESYIPFYVEPDSLVLNGMWYDSVPGVGIRVEGKTIYQNHNSDKIQYEALAKSTGMLGSIGRLL